MTRPPRSSREPLASLFGRSAPRPLSIWRDSARTPRTSGRRHEHQPAPDGQRTAEPTRGGRPRQVRRLRVAPAWVGAARSDAPAGDLLPVREAVWIWSVRRYCPGRALGPARRRAAARLVHPHRRHPAGPAGRPAGRRLAVHHRDDRPGRAAGRLARPPPGPGRPARRPGRPDAAAAAGRAARRAPHRTAARSPRTACTSRRWPAPRCWAPAGCCWAGPCSGPSWSTRPTASC